MRPYLFLAILLQVVGLLILLFVLLVGLFSLPTIAIPEDILVPEYEIGLIHIYRYIGS